MTDAPAVFRRFKPLRALPALAREGIAEHADEAERAAIAEAFGLEAVDLFSVEARLSSFGKDGWRIDGRIAAEIVQSCVVTLEPVRSVIDETFERTYEPSAVDDFGLDEIVIDPGAEDPPEPLGDGIDLGEAAMESLALAIDPYPRAPDAEFGSISAAPPGAEPLPIEKAKPFAGLEALKKAMDGE